MTTQVEPAPKLCQNCHRNVAVGLVNGRHRCQTCMDARKKEMKK